MESEKVKEIKKALEFQRDSLVYLKDNTVEYISCKDILTYINELESENDRLSKKNYHLLEKNRDLIRVCDTCRISIKQFAERLKEKIVNTPHILGGERTIIDETLKEFINKGDDRQ